MIAKLVVWGEDRKTAPSRLIAALQAYQVVGLNTNINFLLSLARHPEFQAGNVHTEFIPQHYDTLFPERQVTNENLFSAMFALLEQRKVDLSKQAAYQKAPDNPYTTMTAFRLNHNKQESITLKHKDKEYNLDVTTLAHNIVRANYGETTVQVKGHVTKLESGRQTINIELEDQRFHCDYLVKENNIYLFTQDGLVEFSLPLAKFMTSGRSAARAGDAVAPMPGVIDKVFVSEGESVEEGQPLVVMIAMKMEYVIRSPKAGVIEKVPFKSGTTVQKGALLVHLVESD